MSDSSCATVEMQGCFGVMFLELAISDLGDLTLKINLNNGVAVGKSVKRLYSEFVVGADLQPMLNNIEMFNACLNGSGRLWRFDMTGGYEYAQEDTRIPCHFSFFIQTHSVIKMAYSRLHYNHPSFPYGYRGAMYLSTIERKLDKEALSNNRKPIRLENEDRSSVDLVTYFNERNARSANWYCDDLLGVEISERYPTTQPKTWWEAPFSQNPIE